MQWPVARRIIVAMSVLRILEMGHPGLRRSAEPIDLESIPDRGVQQLIDDLIETMRAHDGAGLAAPQVGRNVRVCVVEVKENPRYPELEAMSLAVWINPEVEVTEGAETVAMMEGCLSVPGIRGRVERPGEVILRAVDRDGQRVWHRFSGLSASVVQHEVDHLNGILFVDRADTRTLAFVEQLEG